LRLIDNLCRADGHHDRFRDAMLVTRCAHVRAVTERRRAAQLASSPSDDVGQLVAGAHKVRIRGVLIIELV